MTCIVRHSTDIKKVSNNEGFYRLVPQMDCQRTVDCLFKCH